MNLGKWLAENIIKEDSNIKNIVAIYPGRFQPMGAHHAKTYKWLTSNFKDVYVATSGDVQIPKSPFSFSEKKKIINSYGISKVVQVKSPYKAEEILKNYDPKTTAAVFVFGEKDAGRLTGGKFFSEWKGKAEIGYRDGAYILTAPHVSMNVPGYGEMSGTTIRAILGNKSFDKNEKIKIFKGIFGHTKNYDLITKKLESLNENIKSVILEGGAYGHMSHPFDDRDLTFGDFRQIIDMSLQGKLDLESSATEKTDGQNLFITWNKKLLAARNVGDIKRGGINSEEIAKKFSGRGNIENAFNYAMRDLSNSIKSLSAAQLKKIFDDGNNWINMEIIYPASSNVINYDAPHLQFHNVLKYKDGMPIGSVAGGASILAGMIAQVNQSVQKSFTIIGPQFLKINPHQDYSVKKPYFLGTLNLLMSKYKMSDSSTFAEYHQAWWGEFIDNKFKGIDNTIKVGLVKRWAFSDKSFRLNKKTISDEKLLAKAIEIDKMEHTTQVKKNMLPFEKLFFELGAEVLKNAEGFLAADPDKAVQNIRNQIRAAISIIKKGGDIKKINILKQQLDKLNSIGGMNSIVPSEGLVFVYKGKSYKLTGAFAPINQITGMMYF
jgi:hypothetical protein